MQLYTSSYTPSPTLHALYSKTVEDTRRGKKDPAETEMGITLAYIPMVQLTHKTHKVTHKVVFPILTRAAVTSLLQGGKFWLHCFTSRHDVEGS